MLLQVKALTSSFCFKVKSLVRLVHVFTNLFIFFSKNIYSSAAAFGGETPLRAGILRATRIFISRIPGHFANIKPEAALRGCLGDAR